jgi:hypothetical protein
MMDGGPKRTDTQMLAESLMELRNLLGYTTEDEMGMPDYVIAHHAAERIRELEADAAAEHEDDPTDFPDEDDVEERLAKVEETLANMRRGSSDSDWRGGVIKYGIGA